MNLNTFHDVLYKQHTHENKYGGTVLVSKHINHLVTGYLIKTNRIILS